MVEQVYGRVGGASASFRAVISLTQMTPKSGVMLHDVAKPLRFSAGVTESTDCQMWGSRLVVEHARFRLINGHEAFEWTAWQGLALRDGRRIVPFLKTALYEAGGMFYEVGMATQGHNATTSVTEREYQAGWKEAERAFEQVLSQVVPSATKESRDLPKVEIDVPQGFMRVVAGLGSSSNLDGKSGLRRVYLLCFQGIDGTIRGTGRRADVSISDFEVIQVSELRAKRALNLEQWTRQFRSDIGPEGETTPAEGGKALRFLPLERTTIAGVPGVIWTGRAEGTALDVAGAVFAKRDRTYLVTALMPARRLRVPEQKLSARDALKKVLATIRVK